MAEMTFWDHLDELRKVLFRVIGIWFVLAIGYFIAMLLHLMKRLKINLEEIFMQMHLIRNGQQM